MLDGTPVNIQTILVRSERRESHKIEEFLVYHFHFDFIDWLEKSHSAVINSCEFRVFLSFFFVYCFGFRINFIRIHGSFSFSLLFLPSQTSGNKQCEFDCFQIFNQYETILFVCVLSCQHLTRHQECFSANIIAFASISENFFYSTREKNTLVTGFGMRIIRPIHLFDPSAKKCKKFKIGQKMNALHPSNIHHITESVTSKTMLNISFTCVVTNT